MIKYFAKYTGSTLISIRACLPDYEDIPTDCLEITKVDFDSLLSTFGDIDIVKFIAKEAIDKKAGEVRLKYITAVPGQAETYLMKSDEASKLKALGYSLTDIEIQANYPVVYAEMLATGANQVVVCETILGTERAWRQLAATIERERRQGKIEVDKCSNISEIELALQSAFSSLSVL